VHRQYTFNDFDEAWTWMNQVAEIARSLDHHPEWFNVYKTVDVTLATHDAGGVTSLDFTLARAMDALAG
jgi:4a-hydroxytetrahydrobiopterin dehydratase